MESVIITTHRNDHGYWVAKVAKGFYRNTNCWDRKKRKAVSGLMEVLNKLPRPD